jgi:hypothetical protein
MDKPLIIGISAFAAALGYFLFKGTSLKETGDNIRVSLASLPKIHKIDLTGLKISVDLKVDNPAKQRVTVKLPSVRLFYRGKLVASTAVNNTAYTIEPVSTGKITGIMIEASYLSLLTTAPGIVTDFMAQGANITNNIGFEVIAEVNGLPIKVQKL